MRIVITGGGTGGHIVPLVVITQKIREKLGEKKAKIIFIGPRGELEKEFMDQAKVPARHILAGKMRRYFSGLNFIDTLKLPIGFIQSLWHLLWFMPDVIFAKGGYASVPVVIAGWIYRIPIMTHDSDAVPGVANKIIGKFAKRVAISYPTAGKFFLKEKIILTGIPIRKEITKGIPADARQRFGFSESRPVVLVIGGSQGSLRINKAVAKIVPQLVRRANIIHQTGKRDYDNTKSLVARYGIKGGHKYYITPFLNAEELRDALAVADLVISRAGATSIANIAASGNPAILIPLSNAANDHQRMNAYEIARFGGALVLEETNLGEHLLLGKIQEILDNEILHESMSKKIRAFYQPDAGEKIAEGVIELGQGV